MKGYITYLLAKFNAKAYQKRNEYISYMQLNEQTNSLYNRLKTIINQKPYAIVDADRKNLLNKSIFSILETYGRPDYYKANKLDRQKHEIILYKKRLYGYKSKVIYHFINQKLVSVMYRIHTENSTAANNDLHPLLWQQFGLDIYQNPHALLKDKNENIIEVNTQHDIHIDVFYKPSDVVKIAGSALKIEKTRVKIKETAEAGQNFPPLEFTFL